MVRLSEEEIRRRMPVWVALSDLYLDTEIDAVTYKYIARISCASGYTREELRGILFEEVGPAFCGNLLQVAGEWGLFSDEEVERVMRKQLRRRWKFPWPHRKFWRSTRPGTGRKSKAGWNARPRNWSRSFGCLRPRFRSVQR